MESHGSQTADEIENEKLPLPYHPFDNGAEKEERIHVEEDMSPSAMHEHVGEGLPYAEIRRGRIEQRECSHHEVLIDKGRHEHDDVQNDEILCHRRHI